MKLRTAILMLIPQKKKIGSALASCKSMGDGIYKIKFDVKQEEDITYAIFHEITHFLAEYLEIEEDLAHRIAEYAERVLKGGKTDEASSS